MMRGVNGILIQGQKRAVLVLNRITSWSEQHPNSPDWEPFIEYEFGDANVIPYLYSFAVTGNRETVSKD